MAAYPLPHFETISIENPEEYYQVTIDFNGGKLHIDLNFENRYIDQAIIEQLRIFIENIEVFDQQNIAHIQHDYENSTMVKEYIDFHIEELQKDKLEQLVDYNNKAIAPEKQLFNKLRLERVGLYPNGAYGEEYFAVFDYTLDGNIFIDGRRTITDQIIAVKTDKNGELDHLAWES